MITRIPIGTLVLLVVICLPSNLSGQSCPKYYFFMEKGKYLLEHGKPDAALTEFQAAQIAARSCELNTDEPAIALQQVFKKLQKQRDAAILAQKKAKAAQLEALRAQERADREATEAKNAREIALTEKEKADRARVEADTARAISEREKLKTQAALDKAAKIIDAFYFYNDRYALAFKGNKYGYINKDGTTLIPYEYDEALPFNEMTGMATVKINNLDFLIDTTGNKYQIIRDPDYISPASEAIDLSNFGLKRLPNRFSQCKGLKYLTLSGNNLKKHKSLNFDFRQLIQLDLSNNNYSKLPESMLNMKRLEFLNLRSNQLNQINNCAKLISLRTLNVSSNKLTQLPSNIGELRNLQWLNISANLITVLPESVYSISGIQTLLLNFNAIKSLSDSIHLMQNLRHLEASNNKIGQLPDSIGALKNLELLYLSSTGLQSVPKSFAGLTKLRILDLSHNQLKEIPSEFQYLTELREVNLAGNQITFIPEWLSDLPNLQTVYLAGNSFDKIPDKLRKIIVLN